MRDAAVERVYNSLLADGWGNSSITICDVDESVDMSQFIIGEGEQAYIVCDGAHRLAAFKLIRERNPTKFQNFKIPSSYIGKVNYKDRITYAFGNFIDYNHYSIK